MRLKDIIYPNIIQIIPAPKWMRAMYTVDNDKKTRDSFRIVCLALVEEEDGNTKVMGMTYGEKFIELCDEDNFVEYFEHLTTKV